MLILRVLLICLLAMPSMTVSAKPRRAALGRKVQLHYTGRLADGKIFDSSRGEEPLEFTLGDGSMLQAFEDGVLGMKRKESRHIYIPAAQAYGEVDEGKIFAVERSRIPYQGEIKIGRQIGLPSPQGLIPARIVSYSNSHIYLDANHVLAGKDLDFEVELLSISKK